MPVPRPFVTVLLAVVAALAVGTNQTPLWDEDEPRFAAIARTMVETGDWVVPRFNGELAVDKPVLMHWCMAAAMTVFGTNEFACRLPSMIATLLTALALLRAGRRWFDDVVGVVAALAYTGSLLVAIEAHAATPDAILVALTTWATVLLAEAVLDAAQARAAGAAATAPRLSVARAAVVGGLLGLAVVCKGPVGFVGPLAVIVPWAWWLAVARRAAARPAAESFARRLFGAAPAAAWETARELRPLTLTAAALAAALPWYAAVAMRTDGAWPAGFFLVHNVGRFVAPMERHGGGALFHPLALLVGFFPWSCFLPLAVVVAGWRAARGAAPAANGRALVLLLVWLGVWLAAFSAAATKLPNYVLPAYPAAALLVAVFAVDAARRAAAGTWPHPRWLAVGVASLAFGGIATAAVVLVVARYGLAGAEGAALVGLVPVAGAGAVAWAARRHPGVAVATLAVTGLVYTALAVGPAAGRLARANALPGFVRDVQERAGGVRLGTYMLASPNVVFYARDGVTRLPEKAVGAAARFLDSGPEAVLLVPEDRLQQLRPELPPGCGIVGRVRPLFREHDVVAVGRLDAGTPRTAGVAEPAR